jgi:sulfide dehydrogenase [flavocytochrome c] flavoprotein subunit
MMLNRRTFIGGLATGAVVSVHSGGAVAAARRVVVVGGGMGGAALAKYLRLWSNRTIDVTLVEPNATYVSNIMSNLVVTGLVQRSALNFDYTTLARKYGVKVVKGRVTGISDPVAGVREVTVSEGGSTTILRAEKVALSPGISFSPVARFGGGDVVPILHAWVAGPQTELLKKQLAAMPAGGRFVLTIPKAPFRCPPGPYERACLIADYLTREKPGSKIIVLDENPGIVAEAENFGKAFSQTYRGVLDYRPGMKVIGVSNNNKSVRYKSVSALDSDPYLSVSAAVLNVIPPNRANAIVESSGLIDSSGFAPVDVRTFESTIAGKRGIHVLGDASNNTGLPKAGHVGNQGAKICAAAIINKLDGLAVETAPVANSACFSPITNTKASWLTAVYHYDADQKKMVVKAMSNGKLVLADPVEAAQPTAENFAQMKIWFKVLMGDTFA